MPIKFSYKPVLDEKDFAAKILLELNKHEQKLLVKSDKLSGFDLTLTNEVKAIIRSNTDIGAMINAVTVYLNSVWCVKDYISSLFCNPFLRGELLIVVAELDKDYKIQSLTANNIKLAAEADAFAKQQAKKEQQLKAQTELKLSNMKKSASLDKKHLEKSVESLSDVVKTELGGLKQLLVCKDEEMKRLQAENTRLLQLSCRLQKQAASSSSPKSAPAVS
jgi:hypothetical protein